MWIEFISSLSAEVEFADPATTETIDAATGALGQPIPEDLRALLSEVNGVSDQFGIDFLWSAEQIVTRNREMRESVDFEDLYMPFDALLFFGNNAGGDQFAFVQRASRPDVFVWQHESDSRLCVANDLRDYITRYLEGEGEDWFAP